MHKKVHITFQVIELLCFFYLLWWYWSPYDGYLETKTLDFVAFVVNGFLGLVFLFFGVRAVFAKRKMSSLLIVPFAWFLIFFEAFKSPVIYYKTYVDFSIVERVRLHKDGTYDLLREAQTFAEYYEGRYVCRNNSVILAEDEKWNTDSAEKILSVGNKVTFKIENSYMNNTEFTVKKKDKEYWKFLLSKWFWLR